MKNIKRNKSQNTAQKKDSALLSISNYNTKEEEVCSRTKILKKGYKGKIKSRTKKGYERAVTVGGAMNKLYLMNLYNSIEGGTEEERMQTLLSAIYDEDGKGLALREQLYWISEQGVYYEGKKYSAAEVLERLSKVGIIEKLSESNYKKGEGREIKIKKEERLKEKIIEAIGIVVENSLSKLIRIIDEIYSVKTDQIFWKEDKKKQENSKIIAEAFLTAKEKEKAEKYIRAVKGIVVIKARQEEEGLTREMIADLVEDYVPGYQREKREEIQEELENKYKEIIVKRKEWKKGEGFGGEQGRQEKKEEEVQEKKKGVYGVEKNTPSILTSNPSVLEESVPLSGQEAEVTNRPVNTMVSVDSLRPAPISVTSKDQIPSVEVVGDVSSIGDLDVLEKGRKELLKEVPNVIASRLREQASEVLLKDGVSHIQAYNDAIANNILKYEGIDGHDLRQIGVMLKNGSLPTEYKKLSEVSPRVYSSEKENLFYCRKALRVSALEGLGFKDVDLQNCHVEIAVSLWGEKLSKLKEELSKGSIWKYYEKEYKKEGVKFNKKIVKGLHHATFLGGGKEAYKKVIEKEGKELSKEEKEKVIEVFQRTEIYKEIKGLFRELDKEWHGKNITTLTGESFNVRGYRKRKNKKTGKVEVDEGNLLTAIAAVLQSIEVSIMSYIILRCREIFVPILWQHDGLTIKCLYSNTVELMQEALDEYTERMLGRKIKLEEIDL